MSGQKYFEMVLMVFAAVERSPWLLLSLLPLVVLVFVLRTKNFEFFCKCKFEAKDGSDESSSR